MANVVEKVNMRNALRLLSGPLLVGLLVSGAVHAQTGQLPGTAGVIGTPYRVGGYQVILTGAAFATRLAHSEAAVIPEKQKKLLLLNWTVQNPGATMLGFDWNSIRFTVVSADNSNHENAEIALNPDTMTPLNLTLKPTQKIPVLSYIEVPASDPVPKLMLQSAGKPVVRYDLKGKVKKLTGLFAAPDGVTALDAGAARLGERVELGALDFTVEKVESVATALGEVDPGDGNKLVVMTVAFTNPTRTDFSLDPGSYQLAMKDANDEDIEFKTLLRAVGNTALTADIKPGQTVKGRLVFAAGKDAQAGSLTFTWQDQRSAKIALK